MAASNEIILTDIGKPEATLQAAVLPAEGMTLRSLKHGITEVICQNRADEFAKCRKGFGPLIGPHFNQRPKLPEAALASMQNWPQCAALSAMNIKDGWQHGVGRYVPWDYVTLTSGIRATLTGRHTCFGSALRDIQGGDFEMHLEMHVCGNALRIIYTACAVAFPPVIGLHYYFDLPGDDGTVQAPVVGTMQPQDGGHAVPKAWLDQTGRRLNLALSQQLDHVFPLRPGPIALITKNYRLWLVPEKGVQSLVVFHPGQNGWACVEPLSCANPGKLPAAAQKVEMVLTLMIEPA